MPTNPEKMTELQASAKELAKQALETAELGLRVVRTQFEGVVSGQDPQTAELHKNLQNTAFTVENKAKEMFTLATNFMNELNDKWQPHAPAASDEKPAAEKPKAEKIDIDVE